MKQNARRTINYNKSPELALLGSNMLNVLKLLVTSKLKVKSKKSLFEFLTTKLCCFCFCPFLSLF